MEKGYNFKDKKSKSEDLNVIIHCGKQNDDQKVELPKPEDSKIEDNLNLRLTTRLKNRIKNINFTNEKLIDWQIVDILYKKGIILTEFIGKGHRGIVFKGYCQNCVSKGYVDKNFKYSNFKQYLPIAIKISRLGAPKNTIFHEGHVLSIINKQGIGPKVYEFTNDYIVMEYIEGKMIKDCINELNGDNLIFIIEETLKQCLKLDLMGIDHTEIQGGKHVIVSDEIKLIDFDKAKIHNKTIAKNFTTAMSLFFGYNQISKKISKELHLSEEDILNLQKLSGKYKKLFKV
ncbi:putative serine/threonine protein kinase [Methanococcus voltae PS]|uniref:Serine/threonine protein kinase n=1 Tax=Methanococcus voltae PS TaxID=523842 RepID=A0ABT2EXB1_METVO|nr:serine/threonine protein kinase [Methanococcus voltae]MCS3922610.1 putative serine/threonine protein kinase [Methanococcus voltae PS]